MFKKAIVLKVFKANETYALANIKKIISELDLDQYETIPNLDDYDFANTLISRIIPKTIICLSLDANEERKVLLCNPMSSSHIQTPIKVGELIWYFKDTTFDDADLQDKGYLAINHYWHSRVSADINNENPGMSTISGEALNLFSDVSQIDLQFNQLLTLNKQPYTEINKPTTQFNNSLLIQDGNNNIIDMSMKDSTGNIKFISGYDSDVNSHVSNESIQTYSSVISINESQKLFDVYSANNFESNVSLSIDAETLPVIDKDKTKYKSFEKDLLSNIKNTNRVENISNIVKKENDIRKPLIVIKSEDIVIASELDGTASVESDDLENNGKIDIVRSSNKLFNSRITIDSSDNIRLDGETVYVGNFIRNLIHRNIITEEIINDEKGFNPVTYIESLDDMSQIDDMCGKGTGVILGYEKSLTEPLVLGNTLTTLLKDMINLTQAVIEQNKILVEEVKSMASEYSSHTHPPIATQAGPQPVTASLNVASHNSFNTKSSEIEQKLSETSARFNSVNENLKYVLSRFSKTS